MRVTSGIFRWRADAERATRKLQSSGLHKDQIALLVPGGAGNQAQWVPVSTMEQPGMGKALGAVTGAAIGLAAAFELSLPVNAAVRGVVPTTVLISWGAAILGLLGMAVGAAAGGAFDHAMTDGLPADEWFVYKDALRKGRCVVLAFSDDLDTAKSVRALMTAEGAESIDEARKQWWIGLRSAERECYSMQDCVSRAGPSKDESTPLEHSDSQAGSGSISRIPGNEREVELP
jgi:hypothetical protein